jgi:hypothetical protein
VFIVRKIIIICWIIFGSICAHAQNPGTIYQKVVFKQNTLTIGEILKELIHNKKVNLSYAPDALNLKVLINLPSREMVIKDVLYLIGNKTGNKVMLIGDQVIIKKDKNYINEKPVTNLAAPEKTGKQPDAEETPLRDSVFKTLKLQPVRVFQAQNKEFSVTTAIGDYSRKLTKKTADTNQSYVKTGKVDKTRKPPVFSVFSRKKMTVGAGGGIGFGILTNLQDSGLDISTTSRICWHLQVDYCFWLNKNIFIETGVRFDQRNYQVKNSTFRYYEIDSIKFEKVDLRLNSLEIPICLNYAFKMRKSSIDLGAGVYLQMNINGKWSYSNNNSSTTSAIQWSGTPVYAQIYLNNFLYINKFNYGYLGQVGYQRAHYKILFNARLSGNSLSSNLSGKTILASISFIYQILPKK